MSDETPEFRQTFKGAHVGVGLSAKPGSRQVYFTVMYLVSSETDPGQISAGSLPELRACLRMAHKWLKRNAERNAWGWAFHEE